MRSVPELPRDVARLAGEQSAHGVLDLVDEPFRPELEDVVALAEAALREDVDDDHIAGLRRAVVDT